MSWPFHKCKWEEPYLSKCGNPARPEQKILLQKCGKCGRRRMVMS